MPRKMTLTEVRGIIESKGGELLSTEYNNSHSPIMLRTVDGVIESRILSNIRNTPMLFSKESTLKKLSDSSRLTLEKVQEIVNSKGATLLSTKYVNDITPLLIQFSDGEIEERILISVRHSKLLISKKQKAKNTSNRNKHDIEKVRQMVEAKGGVLLSTIYNGFHSPIQIKTADGIVEERTLHSINKSKTLISKQQALINKSKKQMLPIDEVNNIVKKRGGELIDGNYYGNHNPLLVRTVDGVDETRMLSNIQKVKLLVSSGSSFQYEIIDFIKSIYFGKIIINDRTIIKPLELDIVLS